MRSFAPVLVAAALFTLCNAAPVAPSPSGLPLGGGVMDIAEQLAGGFDRIPVGERDVKSKIGDALHLMQSKVSDVHTRDTLPSVAVILTSIQTEIQPFIQELTFLDASNCTASEVATVVASIKASITAAVPQLQALVGEPTSVIMAPTSSDVSGVELSTPQIADIVGNDVELILSTLGHVLDIVNAEGGDIVGDVKDILGDLGSTVTSLVGAILPLVGGISASLGPLVGSVVSIISELHLVNLAVYLNVSI